MKQAKGKGRLRDDGGSRQKPIDQAVMDTYFPRETSTESFSPAPEAAVRIVIPLHSSALAAFAEQSYETHRLLPRGFKGDLRNLEEAQKVHDGRIRKLVAALDMTDATVHFLPGNFVAIDLAAPWSVSEVRQALGIWGSDKLWFDIIDLKNLPSSSGSDISSLSDTDLDAHDVDSYFDTEEVAWYDDAARDLVMPSMLLGADSAETHPDLSQWSSEGKASPSPSVEARELRSFVDELDGMQRPGFAI